MDADIVAPNNLRRERLESGFANPTDLARRADIDPAIYEMIEAGQVPPTRPELDRIMRALGDVSPKRLYVANFRQVLGVDRSLDQYPDVKSVIRMVQGAGRLFVGKHEVTWREQPPALDARADAYLTISCGFSAVPHLMLDAIAACDALGVNYVAVGGSAGCCGKPMIGKGQIPQADRWVQARVDRALAVGARTRVTFCTACHLRYRMQAARSVLVDGDVHPLRDVWFLDFFAERIRELGDRVPWKKRVAYRVLAEGHDKHSPVHADAQFAIGRLLTLVPGVEVVGLYDGFSDESPCGDAAREESMGPWAAPLTAAEVAQRRVELAEMAARRGADTVACQHQVCHMKWGRYASDHLTVKHAVSILAEALGCAHPDRQQVASWLGSAEQVVDQTRPNWESWGMSEEDALQMARQVVDPRVAAGRTQCSCGHEDGESCHEQLISIDVLSGRARPSSSSRRRGNSA